jgi:hypothetical protein
LTRDDELTLPRRARVILGSKDALGGGGAIVMKATRAPVWERTK